MLLEFIFLVLCICFTLQRLMWLMMVGGDDDRIDDVVGFGVDGDDVVDDGGAGADGREQC